MVSRAFEGQIGNKPHAFRYFQYGLAYQFQFYAQLEKSMTRPVISAKNESYGASKTIMKRPRVHAFTVEIGIGENVAPIVAGMCEKLRLHKETNGSKYYTLPSYTKQLTSAIESGKWRFTWELGKTIQEAYVKLRIPYQIIILNRQGEPLFFERDAISSNLYKRQLFFVYDTLSFTGVLNLNQFFKTRYFCPICFRKFSNKKQDFCHVTKS